MTIYKKDGSIYKFSAPNKIMLQQDLWKNYKTYNMKLLANCSIIDKNEQNLNNVLDFTTKKSEEIKEKNNVNIVEPTKTIEQKPETKSKFKKTIAHCLIAKVKEKIDDLYGDANRKIEYSDTFTVEIIVIESFDLTMKLFTTYTNFSLDTIIYPQDMQKRWWQINNIQENEKGFFIDCIPSKLQPSFSI
jgi:hypothetical protein